LSLPTGLHWKNTQLLATDYAEHKPLLAGDHLWFHGSIARLISTVHRCPVKTMTKSVVT
jgi:hypothetical protein